MRRLSGQRRPTLVIVVVANEQFQFFLNENGRLGHMWIVRLVLDNLIVGIFWLNFLRFALIGGEGDVFGRGRITKAVFDCNEYWDLVRIAMRK